MRKYYSLLDRDDATSPWAIQFGSYDRGEVVFERQSLRDHGARASSLKIITTEADQVSIFAAVAILNGEG